MPRAGMTVFESVVLTGGTGFGGRRAGGVMPPIRYDSPRINHGPVVAPHIARLEHVRIRADRDLVGIKRIRNVQHHVEHRRDRIAQAEVDRRVE
jgi:hypothetical protein